jgi:hypothetical protein
MPTKPRTITSLLPDYLESLKEHTVEGQRQSLWTQFLTGVQDQYSALSQQAQDVASYDISQAYANYKQQQLQLQMNEQLGAGFQQQAGQQLQSAYGSAYADIRTQEAETLGKIASEQAKAIETGEKELTSYAEKLRAWDELIVEYGKTLTGEQFKIPDNFRDAEGNLTEEGKLWYYDVLESTNTSGQQFYDWVLGEDTSGKYNLEEREAAYLAYKENPELFTQLTSGLDDSFDVATARKNQQERFYNTAMASGVTLKDNNLKTANSDVGDNFEVTFDGTTYKVEKGAIADNNTQGALTSTYLKRYGGEEIPQGTIVSYKGTLYIYIENNNRNKSEWNRLQGRKNNRDDMNALTTALGLQQARHTENWRGEKGVISGQVKPVFPILKRSK